VTNTLQETRRFIFDLRPMALDDLGLMPTLRKYVQTVSERGKVPVTLSFHGREERLVNYVEVALFRIVQEAVGNAIQHGAPSVVRRAGRQPGSAGACRSAGVASRSAAVSWVGAVSANWSRRSAAPDGRRVPCSHACTVPRLTLSAAAKIGCDSPSRSRIAAIS